MFEQAEAKIIYIETVRKDFLEKFIKNQNKINCLKKIAYSDKPLLACPQVGALLILIWNGDTSD